MRNLNQLTYDLSSLDYALNDLAVNPHLDRLACRNSLRDVRGSNGLIRGPVSRGCLTPLTGLACFPHTAASAALIASVDAFVACRVLLRAILNRVNHDLTVIA